MPLAIGAATLIGLMWQGVRAVSRWLNDEGLAKRLDEMNERLATSQRLAAIGEYEFSHEVRRDAWMRPLKQIARYEYNRSHPLRSTLVAVCGEVWLIMVIAVVLRGQHTWAPTVGIIALAVGTPLQIGLTATAGRVNTKINKAAKERYLAHLDAGRVVEVTQA